MTPLSNLFFVNSRIFLFSSPVIFVSRGLELFSALAATWFLVCLSLVSSVAYRGNHDADLNVFTSGVLQASYDRNLG
jgi:hypothetical protein